MPLAHLKCLAYAALLATVISCTRAQVAENSPLLREYTSSSVLSAPGCKEMVDDYCDYLYSPAAMGNLKLTGAGGTAPIEVLQGHTPNDFPAVYYQYAHAILQSRKNLPKDFRTSLNAASYFDKLMTFLSRKPRASMNLSERTSDIRLASELASLWSTAIENTVIDRMTHRYPGFHNISETMIPLELRTESKRTRRQLRSEIYQAVWNHHPNWLKVESAFENLRRHFLEVISDLKIAEPIKQDWENRIQSVRLVLPGSMPEISDDECPETEINAYYYTTLNVITVCAGDFNSEDIYQTLAHELAHSIDIDRSLYLYQRNSALGVSLAALRGQVCGPEEFSCENWTKFKRDFEMKLSTLHGFSPSLPEFQRCLKPRLTPNELTDADIKRESGEIVSDRIADLADSEIFLRVTKSKIPMPNGTFQKNPNYLNPCSYNLNSKGDEPIDDELSALIFFTGEFRCSSDPDGSKRLKSSIEVAKDMLSRIEEEVLRMEGEFSSEKSLQAEGFSSSPSERFADVVGSEALAYLLNDIPEPKARRSLFLASSSWQCKKPSLAKFFPEESKVQHQYTYGSHSDGEDRKKELIPPSIRLALGCKKDFESNECLLPKSPRVGEPQDLASINGAEDLPFSE